MNTMFLRQLSLLIAALLLVGAAHAQIFLNEVSNRNLAQIADENGDHEDWIELYNAGPAPVNLGGFGLSDDPSRPLKWTLPSISLAPQSHLLVFASGKDRKPRTDHWETAVDENSSWKYFVPNAQPDPAWTTFNFAPAG